MVNNGVIGQRVRALKYLGDAPDGDTPGGTYAKHGEILIIRKVRSGKSGWAYCVSHEHVTDGTFGVSEDEIEDAGADPLKADQGGEKVANGAADGQ